MINIFEDEYKECKVYYKKNIFSKTKQMIRNNKKRRFFLLGFYSLLLICLLTQNVYSQEVSSKNKNENGSVGMFSLGIGNTISMFSDDNHNYTGNAISGQMRIQLWKNINSEWFGDYAVTDVQGKAQRMDAHGGFSIMPYFLANQTSRIQPYPVAGFCIDYSKFIKTGENRSHSLDEPDFLERYSFASQIGLGTHFVLSERIDVSTIVHYMFHLGNDIHIHIEDDDVHFSKTTGGSLEGHVLFSITLNIKLIDLW